MLLLKHKATHISAASIVVFGAYTAGAALASADPLSPPPLRLSDLTAEQHSMLDWNDSYFSGRAGVINCSAHPEFGRCSAPSDPLVDPLVAYVYPADNEPFVVVLQGTVVPAPAEPPR